MEIKPCFPEELSKILVKQGVFTKKEADDLIKDFHGRSKEAFDDFLLSEGLISKENLLNALGEYFQVPAMDIIGYFFDHNLLINFPKEFLIENVIIPAEEDQEFLIIVANRPDIVGLREKIAQFTTSVVEFRVGFRQDILDSIREYYDEPLTYMHDLLDDDELESPEAEEGIDVDEFIDEEERERFRK